jgi:hypothetical protein
MNRDPATARYLRKYGYRLIILKKPRPMNNSNNIKPIVAPDTKAKVFRTP